MNERPSDKIRADLDRMATFLDGRTNGEYPRPTIKVTKARHFEIVRNPGKHGCILGSDGKLCFRTYQLEPV